MIFTTFSRLLTKFLTAKPPLTASRQHSLLRDRSRYKFSKYIILKATKDDYDSVLKVMHECFYDSEPTCYALGIKPNAIIDETALKNMAEGKTLIAKCKFSGSIVGAAINETSNPWDPDQKEKLANHINCPKIKQWLLFQAYAQRYPQLWGRYNVDKVFESSNIFVRKSDQSDEILLRLLEESKTLAFECGFKIFRVNATKRDVWESCEKADMKLTAEIPYCSYIGRNMKPVFVTPPPNKCLKVYVNVMADNFGCT
ncbi:unnamed protein product [Phyllotreta striolata]|uniref:Uncharacterized protein n=1 Tax=Phyllotreta striolata TaxID=444603 RepID=A0A9N9TAX3_PHYSR|nr:unnamed protein product [Phyllotreta striolata]